MDYRASLNLPQTQFPMKAQLPQREPEILEFWEKGEFLQRLYQSRSQAPSFILHDGPPYSNGRIHLGQALNKLLKDFVIKFQTGLGHRAPYVPGWDTHGLPNEIQAIKTFKLNRKEIDPVLLRKKCAESALHFMGLQRDQFRRLGVQGIWEQPYLTLHHSYEAAIIRVFRQLVEGGYVYRGRKPVYWCATCETALAEAEVEYQSKISDSIYVRFPFAGGFESAFPGWEEKGNVLIWTTTPWTLPGNLAIALHPDEPYVLVEVEGRGYVVARAMLSQVAETLGWVSPQVVATARGRELEGARCRHPFLDRDSLVINQTYVTMDPEKGGTGCVHTAPGHGLDDYEAGQEYGLPVLVPVDDEGRMTGEAGPFAGLAYTEANEAICSHLAQTGYLLKRGKLTHEYPHCWRCRHPVIYRATAQWFVGVDHRELRQRAMKAVASVQWIPDWGEGRMLGMLRDRPDWCISRQRVWGTPIPALHCNDCGHEILSVEFMKKVEELFLEEGADAWYVRPLESFLPPEVACPHCRGRNLKQEMDIFDVWFESGVSHEAVLAVREELSWPADLYLEGSDQHRGWFQVSLLPALALRETPPYRAVLTHGWVLDETGHTMHKSLGNVIDPMELVEKYGADVLRLFVSSVDYTGDVRFGHEAILKVAESYRKIRNTCRFMLGNLFDFDPRKHQVAWEDLEELDAWAMRRLVDLAAKVKSEYQAYRFHMVYTSLHTFCVQDLSSVYLDVLKDRLYTLPADSSARRSAQTVLYEMLKALAVMLYPVTSFTAEEIWRHLPEDPGRPPSVMLALWPGWEFTFLDSAALSRWQTFLQVRDGVLLVLENLRRDKVVNSGLETRVALYPDADLRRVLEGHSGLLADLFLVSALEVAPEGRPAPEEAVPVPGLPGLAVTAAAHGGPKCPRCWHYVESLSDDPLAPGVCPRCRENLLAALDRESRAGRG